MYAQTSALGAEVSDEGRVEDRGEVAFLFAISQRVPIEAVSRMMGYPNIKTTTKIAKGKISHDMEALLHKIEGFGKQI